MTGDDLRKHVLAWLVENHNLRPAHAWRIEVARRLVCDDMQAAWDELAKHGATDGRHILSFVIDAAEDAHRECVRLASGEESGRIAEVADALDTLREAIAHAPSPFLDGAYPIEIDGRPVAFSWRKTGAKVLQLDNATQSICLDELLEIAHGNIIDIAAHQPGGMLARSRERPQLTAFVRYLAGHFEKRYDGTLTASVARIAATTYGDPITEEQTERILGTQPQ
ncbi:MAG: hypothetical protein ROZ09_03790 [Thiobacillus sp.]|jgi:hypothetical protein|uniref:hypothetical protein n=1 Tax=Thiobacillus sp. TaxID=924 RepID=UPI002895AA2E|nr:hypothetical protein [Thiobacillus sp.]MDT3705925.1 hypothetical protein [Thiobacillus sp.]